MTPVSAAISICPVALATRLGDEMIREKVLELSRIEKPHVAAGDIR